VKAKNIGGAESNWSDPLPITMPKNKPFFYNFPLLNWLVERFPNAFPALRHLLGLYNTTIKALSSFLFLITSIDYLWK